MATQATTKTTPSTTKPKGKPKAKRSRKTDVALKPFMHGHGVVKPGDPVPAERKGDKRLKRLGCIA